MRRILRLAVVITVGCAGLGTCASIGSGYLADGSTEHHPDRVAIHAGKGQDGTTVNIPTNRTETIAPKLLDAVHHAAAHARLGAAIYDLEAGKTVLSVHPDREFRSASLVKLLIAIDALQRRQVSPHLRHELHRMLALSDDRLASALWEADGGTAIVARTAATIGLTGTRPPADPGMWGNTLLSARDVVRVYRYILHDLPQQQRKLLMTALGDTARHAADGWDQYFGIPDAVNGTLDWAVKQGWSDSGDDLVLHSTGVLGDAHWHYVVVLLVSCPHSTGWQPMRDALTSGAETILPSLESD